jgi:N-acetylglucosaminyl-diphospho-decaprenol L-rhamnosyltransferase
VSFTIVTVLHDSAPELAQLLRSLRDHLPDDTQLVAVDSGSRDDGPALATAAGAEVIVLDGNPGFGAASNAGVARAHHDVTVLLNPDCELRDAALADLAGRAAGFEALLVPRLIEADGALQRSAHPLPGRPSALVRALLPTRALPQPHRARRPRRVGWAIAACLAAPTALLRRLGPFDPEAFLFYEDMDLCLRAQAAGVPTILHPEVVVRHLGGRSTARAFGGEAFELQARRRREVVGARLGPRALRIDDGAPARSIGRSPPGGGERCPAGARALPCAGPAAVGRERGRNLAALRALRAARRMATAARRHAQRDD